MPTDGITPIHGPTDHPKHPQFIMVGGDRYYIASGPDKSAPYKYYNGHWYNYDSAYAAQQQMKKQMELAREQMRMQAKYQELSLASQQEYNEAMRSMAMPREPEKEAANASAAASAAAAYRQQRRRGLLSTFTRYGSGSGMSMASGNTQGKATLLGG